MKVYISKYRYHLFAGLMLYSLQAHAVVGLALGMAVGSSMSTNNDVSVTTVDVRTPTLICEAYYFRHFQEGLCNYDSKKIPLATYVSKMGYKMYRKRQVVFANTNYYTVLDVWK